MNARLIAGSLASIAGAGVIAGTLLESAAPLQWVFIVLALVLPGLGFLLAVRRPELRYGWLLLAAALFLGLGAFGTGWTVRFGPSHLSVALSAMMTVFYGLTWIFIPLLFPDGRLPSRRWRPVAWLGAVAVALHTLGNVFLPFLPGGGDNPITPHGLVAVFASGLGQALAVIVGLVVLIGLVVRRRRALPPERGQYTWMVAGTAANVVGFVALVVYLTGNAHPVFAVLGLLTTIGSLPAAILVAIVRYRLLDLRLGLRGSRLHLIFDLRPTVDEVLTDLGSALAETPEPVEQLDRLAGAVRGGLDVRWAAVTLPDGTRVVSGQEEGEPVLTLPVRGQGRIECGPRNGGRLTAEDRRLLAALAVPVGLAIQNAGLITRLVNAQEAERRRIERNIHDGVQQQLVALIAGLELARAMGEQPAAARASGARGGQDLLAGLREQARQTLQDLRELAAGIHPSVLSQGGLVEAVEERCSRLPVHTTVTAEPGLRARRYADEIEGAMYFTVSEAVANALKHAGASAIEVRLEHAGGRLRATVADDGRGFGLAGVQRRGLATLADRLDALGGGLELHSEQGKGTRMNAWVPVDA
ncbi:hypothetical protein HII36_18760 [Nonomuraea sp. NN258]|uniref:sensor histidine kinase n=1 Tax=Nonomuraea antri TaxID=2730852 RepID=UPI001569CDC9|nr:histidine kinase [Nonomuraea antri]NRQ33879.1 hypothetical protein [Nonomuraea antri]